MDEPLRALVVDDEEGVRFFLSETLRRSGHVVVTASSGEEALERLRDTCYEVVLLDLRLGGRVGGLRVLEAVRWRWPEAVVIILTAHGSLESAVSAIQEGVDGYLLKPVEAEDVRRVIRTALERRQRLGLHGPLHPAEHTLQGGPLALDLQKHTATCNGQPLELTPPEFRLLACLIENAHRVVSPLELVQAAQGYTCAYPNEARELVKWYIHRLRRKVEFDPKQPHHIVNVRGVGYRFVD
jgi:DNA-binding response OmpR family regulator